MLNKMSPVSEIDNLIKNMEALSPNYNEKMRILKLYDLKRVLENKDLLALVKDIDGSDWEDDTRRLLKRMETKEKMQQFTDVYLNNLRCFLIFRVLDEQTSSAEIELCKDYGNWIFNAIYEGSDKKDVWFNVKINRYFKKTDLPKKFNELMGNKLTFMIDHHWVLENERFFYDTLIFKSFEEASMEFMKRLMANEQLPELEKVKDLPVDSEDGAVAQSSVTGGDANATQVVAEVENKPQEQSVVQQILSSRKMVQIGVDVAGDPILVSEEEAQKMREAAKAKDVEPEPVVAPEVKAPVIVPPWEDEIDLEEQKQVVEEAPVAKVAPAVTAPTKPGSFGKPGSFMKPGSTKPGSGAALITSDYGDDIAEEPADDAKGEVFSKPGSITNIKPAVTEEKKIDVSSPDFNPNDFAVVPESEIDEPDVASFEDLLKETKNKEEELDKSAILIKPEDLKKNEKDLSIYISQENSSLELREQQKQNEINKINETIERRKVENTQKIQASGLKTSIFMSIK